jgi:S-methylmethionine-dependent homocysteine/selenocysteine methylase
MGHSSLPQLDRLFLTDAGLETDLIFNRGIDLPCFASITLLQTVDGRELLREYFRSYLSLAVSYDVGIVLEGASWRASPGWAEPLGVSVGALDALNVASIELLHDLRDEYASSGIPIVISACMGPRGDGYDPGQIMSRDEAENYHTHQAGVLASAKPDMLSAFTMNNVNEAIGITRAAASTGLPFALSFTVETDGRLPTGDALGAAIEAVDAATGAYPAYYMVNCAHPTHFAEVLARAGDWVSRIQGIRANASRCSHAELDAMTELDDGDPLDLGRRYRDLRDLLPQINVLGGCCGTDHRHVQAIAAACTASEVRAA